jgi:hypothetical protein
MYMDQLVFLRNVIVKDRAQVWRHSIHRNLELTVFQGVLPNTSWFARPDSVETDDRSHGFFYVHSPQYTANMSQTYFEDICDGGKTYDLR